VSDELKRSFRRANIVLGVATPLFFAAVVFFRDAGKGVLLGLGLIYFAGSLVAALALDVRAERRRDQ
jgi:hypothetical protein